MRDRPYIVFFFPFFSHLDSYLVLYILVEETKETPSKIHGFKDTGKLD